MSKVTTFIRRELRVCFSRQAQPLWFRILKWMVFLALAARYHGASWFWLIVAVCFVAGLGVHFFYRAKTRGWTCSWGGWSDLATGRN